MAEYFIEFAGSYRERYEQKLQDVVRESLEKLDWLEVVGEMGGCMVAADPDDPTSADFCFAVESADGELVRAEGTRLAVVLGRRVDVHGSDELYERARAASQGLRRELRLAIRLLSCYNILTSK